MLFQARRSKLSGVVPRRKSGRRVWIFLEEGCYERNSIRWTRTHLNLGWIAGIQGRLVVTLGSPVPLVSATLPVEVEQNRERSSARQKWVSTCMRVYTRLQHNFQGNVRASRRGSMRPIQPTKRGGALQRGSLQAKVRFHGKEEISQCGIARWMVGSWGNCTQDNATDCTSFQFRNVFCEQILANNVPSLVGWIFLIIWQIFVQVDDGECADVGEPPVGVKVCSSILCKWWNLL